MHPIRFVTGALLLPEFPGMNNRGVLTDQLVDGHTHVEAYLFWRTLEPQQDTWRWDAVDEHLALMSRYGQRMLPFPWLMYAPQWFADSPRYVPLQEMHTEHTVDVLSLWAPGTWWAYDHFYAQLARRYRNDIDVILVALPSSDYGEAGYPMGAFNFAPGVGFGMLFPQDPRHWRHGMWCGDPYARRDFLRTLQSQYRTLPRLNAAWNASYTVWDDVAMPAPEARYDAPRAWLDLTCWYTESQVRATAQALRIVRKHFPRAYLEIALGNGCDRVEYGVDRSRLCRVIAEFGNAGVRSTHASNNRNTQPNAYWFYQRMAPVCRAYGGGFGVEPPGGDLTLSEMRRQLFEDSSVGLDLMYTYYQNWHVMPHLARQWTTASQLPARSRVSIAMLFPNTQMALDRSEFPKGQLELFNMLRPYTDMAVVDEQMIRWGLLRNIRVLINTSGSVFPSDCLRALTSWIDRGGLWIDCTKGLIRNIEGKIWPTQTEPGQSQRKVGKGRFLRLDAGMSEREHTIIRDVILQEHSRNGPLDGVNRKQDGKWRTQFPTGWLAYDPITGRTRWEQDQPGDSL